MRDMLLVIHEILSFMLFYSCFCRSVKMTPDTERDIRLAFWVLSIASVVSLFAPLQGWRPDYIHIVLLIAFSVVQFSTAKYWRHETPEHFRKAEDYAGRSLKH